MIYTLWSKYACKSLLAELGNRHEVEVECRGIFNLKLSSIVPFPASIDSYFSPIRHLDYLRRKTFHKVLDQGFALHHMFT
jgi:hypothetical protein